MVLYALIAIVAIRAAGFVYSTVTGSSLAGSSDSAANLLAWLHVSFGVAVLGGCLTLVVLAFIAPYRRRLTAITVKLVALPFLLIPVLLVDLVGASPSFTLGLLGMQVLYLIILPR